MIQSFNAQTVVFFYCIKNTVNKIVNSDLEYNIYQPLLYLQVEKTIQLLFKLNEQLMNHVVCTPTTNHTCLSTILLIVITLNDCFMSFVYYDKHSYVQ